MKRVLDLPEYQSPWLTCADLAGRPRRLTIADWTVENVRQRDGTEVRKVAVAFAGARKRLLLNHTQARVIDSALGDLENWPGKLIILQPARTAGGQQTIEITVPPQTSTEDVRVGDTFESQA